MKTLLAVARPARPAAVAGAGDVRAFLRGRSRIKWVSEADEGIYDAMNKGIRMTTGEIIGTLNADDYYASDDVLAEVRSVMADPEVDGCYADLDYIEADNPARVVRAWRSCAYRKGLFRQGWMPAHPTFFVRKSVYEKWGLFDLRYRLAADFELTMRFIEVAGIRTRYVPRVWVKMRVGGATNGKIRNILRGNWESFLACWKNGIRVPPWFVLHKILSRLPQFFQ